ncbi:hypothetical protein [Nocardia abscessus]|uniref:hypothetical protein n=1 Tax=Nocardia abscessus TaxID=120957 RepID=UPI002454EC5C|nr:hypothetical protein [Nocardia abscessus]
MILSAFNAVSDLLFDVMNKELGFLESLVSNTIQQASQVDEVFSGLAGYLTDEWGQVLR